MNTTLTIVLLISFLNCLDNQDVNEVDNWLKYYQLSTNDFNSKTSLESLNLSWDEYFPVDNSYRKHLDRFFIFSPDSTFFIDLDSYNLAMESIDGKLVSHGFEVDTKIQLIRVEDNKTTGIVFFGPSCIIESAQWISRTRFCLLGFLKDEEEYKFRPTIWNIDINELTIYSLTAKKEFAIEKIEYRQDERLNSIEFKF